MGEEKRVPVLVGSGGARTGITIPWALAEEAYLEYVKRYGSGQTLERIYERGGFYAEELDMLRPGWRPVAQLVETLRAREAVLKGWLRDVAGLLDEEHLPAIADKLRSFLSTVETP